MYWAANTNETSNHTGSHEEPENFWHANRNDRDYTMLWRAACMCFFGFMRAGELVVPSVILHTTWPLAMY